MGVVWTFDTGVSMFSTHYGTLNILISLFQHPVVKVVESDNEMVISDYYTDEFIAKKIFFSDQQHQSGQKKEQNDDDKMKSRLEMEQPPAQEIKDTVQNEEVRTEKQNNTGQDGEVPADKPKNTSRDEEVQADKQENTAKADQEGKAEDVKVLTNQSNGDQESEDRKIVHQQDSQSNGDLESTAEPAPIPALTNVSRGEVKNSGIEDGEWRLVPGSN